MVVTTQSNGNGRRAFQALGGLGVALFIAAACAGTDTPPRTRSLEAEVINRYEPTYAMGNAGGSSMAGASGGGQGGSASANAGAGGSANAGGSSGGGSAGAGMAGSGSTSNACDAPGTVLVAKCGDVGCHGAGSGFGDFGASAAAAEALVDEPAGCNDDLLYFDSASPEDSLVVTKLEDSPPCGSPMPLGDDPLSPAEIECILDWVSQF